MIRTRLPGAALAALLALACTGSTDSSAPVVASIAITGLHDSVAVGDVLQLKAEPRDAEGRRIGAVRVTWQSLLPGVASVEENGLLSAYRLGDARLVVSTVGAPVRADTILVRVRSLPRAVDIQLAGDSVLVGGTVRATVKVRDGSGLPMYGVATTWSSSDTLVLAVDDSGRVHGREEGVAWVRAHVGTVVDSVPLRARYARWPYAVGPLVQISISGYYGLCGTSAAGVGRCSAMMHWSMYGSDTPNTPIPGHVFTSVQTSALHVCGLRADSTVVCWGRRRFGQLGDGRLSPDYSSTPVVAADGRKFSQLSVGRDNSTCAIAVADSVVYCWGKGDSGQTGNTREFFPDSIVRPVSGSLRARQVSLGGFHGCAIGVDDATWCWGWKPGFLTTAPPNVSVPPQQVAPPGRYTQVSAGFYQTCALDAAGAAWCWGEGVPSATGTGSATPADPRRVEGKPRFVTIDAGGDGRGCALTADGRLWCWSYVPSASPSPPMTARVMMPTYTFVQLASAWERMQCALSTDREVLCWGW